LTRAQDYDISFLITNFHTEAMYKGKVVDFVIDFIQVLILAQARAEVVVVVFMVAMLMIVVDHASHISHRTSTKKSAK
jgi:hypothetical protein